MRSVVIKLLSCAEPTVGRAPRCPRGLRLMQTVSARLLVCQFDAPFVWQPANLSFVHTNVLRSISPTRLSGHPRWPRRSYQHEAEHNEKGKQLDIFFVFLGTRKLGNISTLTSLYAPFPSVLVANLTKVYLWLFALLKIIILL